MAIVRTVTTIATCDKCGKMVAGWKDDGVGISKAWAKFFIKRDYGCQVSDKYAVTCLDCRIKTRIKNCAATRKRGTPWIYGVCVGFEDHEPCTRCIANIERNKERFKYKNGKK